MKEFNLIPDRILYRKQRYFRNFLKTVLIIAAVAVIGMALAFRSYQRMELQKKVDTIKSTVDTSVIKKLEAADQAYAQKNKEIKELDSAISKVPKVKISTTDLFDRVTAMIPPSISAEGMEMKAADNTLLLNLNGDNQADIVLLLKRLHDDVLFSGVAVGKLEGKDSTKFVVEIRLK